MHESESEVVQLCPTLSDPMDCSLPGSSVHGIFLARVLEWIAIAFSFVLSPFFGLLLRHRCSDPIKFMVQQNSPLFSSYVLLFITFEL